MAATAKQTSQVRIWLSLFASLLLATSAAGSGLHWEQRSLILHPQGVEGVAIGHFKYKNDGSEAVHFRNIHPSCGCTIAQSQQQAVEPGQEGEITATFRTGDRVGLQVKTVTVETDDTSEPKTVLTLKVVLPELLEIKPTFVYWKTGETAGPKSIVVHPNKVRPVSFLTVTSSSPLFRVDTSRLANGDFAISVRPAKTVGTSFTALTIQGSSSPKRFYANARVLAGSGL
ncbi:MAG TPA: DUF1573 domain-containing protein [Steroidobacteraceae bacterium]